jgi:hypothetical protein
VSNQSGRLQHALKTLRERWELTRETWDDQVAREFEITHLQPLEHMVKHTMIGMDKFSEVLAKLRRQCEE